MRLSIVANHMSYGKSMNFCIFGAPGVGKGTYAQMLKKDLCLLHISTGNQIRSILQGQSQYSSQLINKMKKIVRQGGLVPDEIVINIIKQKINSAQNINGIILDGFPRTKTQLHKYLQTFKFDGVLNIFLRKDVLVDKLLGRRVCNKCDISYNVCDVLRDGYCMPAMLPKKEGKCDSCGSQLKMRQDDKIQVIEKRMKEYQQSTKPLLEEFQKMGLMVNFQPKNGVKDYPKMKKLIENMVKSKQ